MIGIYKITSPTGKIYIGQSINIEKRWIRYKNLNCKEQPKIYNYLKKHSAENHVFEVVIECNDYELNDLEKYYVDIYGSFNSENGLNLKDGGGQNGRHSNESRKKMSDTRIKLFGKNKIIKNTKIVKINYNYGFEYKGARYAWKDKKLFRLSYIKGLRTYSFKEIPFYCFKSTIVYNIQRTKLTINKLKLLTVKVNWSHDLIIDDDCPF